MYVVPSGNYLLNALTSSVTCVPGCRSDPNLDASPNCLSSSSFNAVPNQNKKSTTEPRFLSRRFHVVKKKLVKYFINELKEP